MKQLKAVLISVGLSFVFVFITYFVMNEHVPLTSEKAKLQLFEMSKQLLFPSSESHMTDSVILIDTHYDQQFVMERESEPPHLPIGMIPVADRNKLLRCLNYLKERGGYKYILMDIFLDKDVRMESDTTLYQQIATMPNLILAKPLGHQLADKCLEQKAAPVQYSQAIWEGDFVKFPYLQEGETTLPLKMYNAITQRNISQWGPLYFDKGLVRNCVILTYENLDLNKRLYLGGMKDYPIEEMLEDYDITNKYILIGDFEDDMHKTFYGDIPGTMINFYAYLALLHGHHRITIGIFLFLLFVFALPIYLKITRYESIKKVYEKVVKKIFRHKFFRKVGFYSFWGTFVRNILSYIISPWLGYPLYLTIVCWFTYVVFGEAYDILITTTLFYIMNLISICYQESKTK